MKRLDYIHDSIIDNDTLKQINESCKIQQKPTNIHKNIYQEMKQLNDNGYKVGQYVLAYERAWEQ
eukprot:snap_masked-scaffold_51-processed-gene-1.8-mRNA-1 protein AED:1.00 eAED:1.00 QI:0/0/0/0/1/1/2/0/64